MADRVTYIRLAWAGGVHDFQLEAPEPPRAPQNPNTLKAQIEALKLEADRARAAPGHHPAYLPGRAAETLKRLTGGFYGHEDVAETIRCGLIGGGDMPSGEEWATAAALIEEHVLARPLALSVPLAQAILIASIYGVEEELADAAGTAEAFVAALTQEA